MPCKLGIQRCIFDATFGSPAEGGAQVGCRRIARCRSPVGLWKRAAHLTHPNLLTIFDAGRCRLDDLPFIYAVMEFAEENLGEILPQRALTADEVRDVLDPALDVLVYLHGKGLVHGT